MRSLLRRSLVAALVAVAALSLKHFSTDPLQAASRTRAPAIPKFKLQYWDVPNRVGLPSFTDLNNLGQIAGWYTQSSGERRAFLYNPQISATTALDLEDTIGNAGVPDGWRIDLARDINDDGVILGRMVSTDPDTGAETRWAFLLDTLAASPAVVPLPDLPGITQIEPLEINNDGDLLCKYQSEGVWSVFFFNPLLDAEPYYLGQPVLETQLSNSTGTHAAQVGGRLADGSVFRWTPESNSLQNVGVNAYISDMNDAGHMAGAYNTYPMRLITPPPRTFSYGYANAWSINNSDDIVMTKGYMYRDDVGYVALKSYLSGSTADLALWSSASTDLPRCINDRGAISKYGQIAGYLNFSGGAGGVTTYQPYLLTPIVKTR